MIDKDVKSKLMTLKEVADYLRVTERTIHKLLDKKAIPAVKVGSLWRFDSDVAQIVNNFVRISR
ncbi:MAG: helix-turn-helix domain-containing protein [Dehalococcoidales bacterium]|jgi:excisionase family DNA binding protein|nr:helix-turn-helix domain-containing protein [Dehalococcoidales bacterium]